MTNEHERQDQAREDDAPGRAAEGPAGAPEEVQERGPQFRDVEGPEALRAEARPRDPEEAAAQFEEADQAMEALRRERDDLFARLQRVSADYQNSMRRADQKLADAVDLARGDMLKGFIPVLDHFDRALQAEPSSEDARSLARGMAMVRDELLKVLQHAGVERVDTAQGEPFDPHRHEAMLRQPAEGVRPNHIAAAFEPGYVYKGRTLRPAKVAVAPEE